MYNGMQIYRAVVTASSSTTGSIYVSIPSVLGTSTSIAVSTIGRAAVSGVWTVPNVGDQVLVAVEDDKFSNVFLLYPVETSIAPGSVTETTLGLTEVKVRRAVAYTVSENAFISFDTEDADANGFFPSTGTTITVPSGKAGLYAIGFYGSAIAGNVNLNLQSGNSILTQMGPSYDYKWECGDVIYLSVGDTIRVLASGNEPIVNFTCRLWMTRIMD